MSTWIVFEWATLEIYRVVTDFLCFHVVWGFDCSFLQFTVSRSSATSWCVIIAAHGTLMTFVVGLLFTQSSHSWNGSILNGGQLISPSWHLLWQLIQIGIWAVNFGGSIMDTWVIVAYISSAAYAWSWFVSTSQLNTFCWWWWN